MKNKPHVKQPKFYPSQYVEVFNYRRKSKENKQGTWEIGKIIRCNYHLSVSADGKTFYGRWSYEVMLDRKSKVTKTWGDREIGGNTLWVTVGDESLNTIK